MYSQDTVADPRAAVANDVGANADAPTAVARLSAARSADLFTPYGKRWQRSRFLLLLAGSSRTGAGVGAVVPLEDLCQRLLVVTLGITDVVERTGLTVSIWGSTDQLDWGPKPLATFRERQYCGVYSVLLNLAARPDIRYLRAQWTMNRWGRGERPPVFEFEVFVEESGARVGGSAIA